MYHAASALVSVPNNTCKSFLGMRDRHMQGRSLFLMNNTESISNAEYTLEGGVGINGRDSQKDDGILKSLSLLFLFSLYLLLTTTTDYCIVIS